VKKTLYTREAIIGNRERKMNTQKISGKETPEMGAIKTGNKVVFFVNGKKFELTRKEIETMEIIARNGGLVVPFSSTIFGLETKKQSAAHAKRIFKLRDLGIIQYTMVQGLLRVAITELGLKILDMLMQL